MNKTKACSAGLACGILVLDLEGERVTEFYGRQKSTLLLTDGLVAMLKCSWGTKALSPAFLSLVGLSSVFQTKTLLLKHCLTFECGTCDTPLGSALSARPDQVSITTQTHSTKKTSHLTSKLLLVLVLFNCVNITLFTEEHRLSNLFDEAENTLLRLCGKRCCFQLH